MWVPPFSFHRGKRGECLGERNDSKEAEEYALCTRMDPDQFLAHGGVPQQMPAEWKEGMQGHINPAVGTEENG